MRLTGEELKEMRVYKFLGLEHFRGVGIENEWSLRLSAKNHNGRMLKGIVLYQ